MKSEGTTSERGRGAQRSFDDRPMEVQDRSRFGYSEAQAMQQQCGTRAPKPVES